MPRNGNPDLVAGPGRPKGIPNKITTTVKEAFHAAFQGIGGVPALIEWASKPKNQTEFYKLYSRLIPTDVKVTGSLSLVALVEKSLSEREADAKIDQSLTIDHEPQTIQ